MENTNNDGYGKIGLESLRTIVRQDLTGRMRPWYSLGNITGSSKEEAGLEKEVMTAEELAEYLSFSKNWVYRKAEAGELPGVKLGNRWRFKKSVIDRWLEKRIAAEERGEAGAL